jgi:hypothetical protein
VTELRELADGRADLLAEVAGVLEGTREGELDEPLARQAAGWCRKAEADAEAIPAWIAEGRRRGPRRICRRSRAGCTAGECGGPAKSFMEVLLVTDDRGFGPWPRLRSRGERMHRGFFHCGREVLVREPVP